jgi:GMP synthase-like glutamine amidotransferase
MNRRQRVVVVQHTAGSGPGRLPEWLAEAGIDADVVAASDLPDVSHPSAEALPSAGRPPGVRAGTRIDLLAADGQAVNGLILLGGGLMPDDDERYRFLPRERALLGEALAAEVPVLGICLGAQMLALVAGGQVTARSGETERGSCRVDLLAAADDDSLFAGLTGYDGLRMRQNHHDSITALPPSAVHLATSKRCRVQAFRVDATAWGVQFHPEASGSDTEQARALIGAFANVVREARR